MLAQPSASERIYLDTLGRSLGLDTGLLQEIHATVEASRSV
jgi:uncharacterized membrane protein YebE (DUF533 family)